MLYIGRGEDLGSVIDDTRRIIKGLLKLSRTNVVSVGSAVINSTFPAKSQCHLLSDVILSA